MQAFLGALVFFALSTLTVGSGFAAKVGATSTCDYDGEVRFCVFNMRIKGEIDAATVSNVRKALAEVHNQIAIDGSRIDIDSPGGSVDAAIQIGRIFRSISAPVFVDAGTSCISACVLILAGATSRAIAGGRIGIHRPYINQPPSELTTAVIQRAYGEVVFKIRAYLREMNVSEKLADEMMAIPPEQVRFLNKQELEKYGLGERDPVYHELLELGQARKYGIDRKEYIRRMHLVRRDCIGKDRIACREKILVTGRSELDDGVLRKE